MALLVLMTGIVTAGQTPATAKLAASNGAGLAVSHAGQGDFGLAVLSILLGGGMFYLFRPIRRVPVEIVNK
ncbi:MAG: hypothetical protein JW849_00245 [Phycisphaerae bacterium]|nr:hypothetical protein [Phycisphaerae bacterium]